MTTKNKHSLHPSSLRPHPFVRVFCAVELPTEARERAAEHAARLRERFSEVRASWPRAENLHLTLKFLGEIEEGRVEALSKAAERAARLSRPFKLSIEGAGAFPRRGVPRVLWLGVTDSSSGLARLQNHLEDECEREGFEREERSFHPHLTLARLRAQQGARALAQSHQETGFGSIEFPVTELVVMRSELGPGGSRYTTLSRHELGTGQSF
ncbi:MAG TPA: RNA 2',3'-cyclic phosphodiesterase [Pyrinomonadaceae bacterium]|nr:RNA 2',3'-cyclic phosphodiesterase [Pyrinomonadaceae bacterium]